MKRRAAHGTIGLLAGLILLLLPANGCVHNRHGCGPEICNLRQYHHYVVDRQCGSEASLNPTCYGFYPTCWRPWPCPGTPAPPSGLEQVPVEQPDGILIQSRPKVLSKPLPPLEELPAPNPMRPEVDEAEERSDESDAAEEREDAATDGDLDSALGSDLELGGERVEPATAPEPSDDLDLLPMPLDDEPTEEKPLSEEVLEELLEEPTPSVEATDIEERQPAIDLPQAAVPDGSSIPLEIRFLAVYFQYPSSNEHTASFAYLPVVDSE